MTTKLDAESRQEVEDALEQLESVGWDIVAVDTSGEPGAIEVKLNMVKCADGKHILTSSGGLDR